MCVACVRERERECTVHDKLFSQTIIKKHNFEGKNAENDNVFDCFSIRVG
jgi:hypothetical protein